MQNVSAVQVGELDVRLNFQTAEAARLFVKPTLNFTFGVSARGRTVDAHDIIVTDMVCKMSLLNTQSQWHMAIGHARPQTLQTRWTKQHEHTILLTLVLDNHTLAQIERIRAGQKLNLKAEFRFLACQENERSSFTEVQYTLENILIEKSKWIEDILPQLNFKAVALVEIPKLEYPDLAESIEKINVAWKKYSAGETKEVLVKCREVLEDVAQYIKKNGFESEVDEGGKKRTLPDWKKFLDNEDRGNILGTINQKANAFVVKGAHTGSIIDIDDAYFALLQTFSIVHYMTSHMKKRIAEF